jgi:hypothetical protein
LSSNIITNSDYAINLNSGANTLTLTGLISITGNVSTGGNLTVANNAVINGNLLVSGNTTFINTNVITTNDKSITLANNQSTAANVDGAGIDIGVPTVAYWQFNNATTSWQTNINITPVSSNSLNLGGTANYWNAAYINSVSITTANVTGNITGGNILTGGLISATGNITGGNISIPNGRADVTSTANTVGGGATVGVRSILAIDSAFGSNDANDPASAQAVRGRVTGSNLTKTRNYVAGVTGQYLVTGTNASEFINTGLLGVVGDQTTTANAAVVAYLDGDGGLTTANAAYAVSMKNSTVGSGFDYGLDLQFIDLNLAGTTAPFKQADIRFNNGVELVANVANTISLGASLTVTGNANIGNIGTAGLITATGNITGGNLLAPGAVIATLLTGGNLQVTGNANASYVHAQGYITTAGYVSAIGNVIAGNLDAVNLVINNISSDDSSFITIEDGVNVIGEIFATGNVDAGNMLTAGLITATGNITGGNVLTGGLISATGNITAVANITGGNLLTGGLISATANITGGNITTAGLTNTASLSITGNTATVTTANYSIGYLNIPQISLAANSTIALTDSGKHYYSVSASNLSLTIANNTSVVWPVGTSFVVVNRGSANVTVAPGSGVSLYLAGNVTSANRTITTYGQPLV